MPDASINPTSISNRADSAAPGNPKDGTPAPSKPPPLTTSTSQKGTKPAQVCPRVDIEPLYTALKAGVGEHWTSYKNGVSQFVLGHLSLSELVNLTSPFLYHSDTLLHQHNQLVLALTTNITREPPDATVAPWVAANDKPTATSAKPLAGDNAAEHRLKHEVMQLPARQRARIKNTADDPIGPLVSGLASEAYGRRLPAGAGVGGGVVTPLTAAPPASSSTATTGLSKDQEIRKRYHQQLMQESQDLPTKAAITARVEPIAYEEGLMSGVSQPGNVASLMNVALQTFLKESLGEWLSATRTDPPLSDPLTSSLSAHQQLDDVENAVGVGTGGSLGGVYTARYKKTYQRELAQAKKGSLKRKRNEMGLLPVELERQKRANYGRGREGDVGIAWQLARPRVWRDLVPSAASRLALENDFEEEEEETVNGITTKDVRMVNGIKAHPKAVPNGLPNGLPKKVESGLLDGASGDALVNGDTGSTNHDRDEDAVLVDEMDWGWEGAGAADGIALDDVLDGCLSL